MYSNKTTIMTIRHGETEFNRQKRYAGLLDISLNAKGINDCHIVSEYFVESVDIVITSKLKRCIETARILTGNSKPIIKSALCNERNFGQMQGRTSQEVELIKPEIHYIKIGGDFHSLNPPEGERFPALHRRAKEFFKFLRFFLSERYCTRILIVSHEVFLLQFHGVLRRESWRESMRHRLPNLTLSMFTLQGDRLQSENSRTLISETQGSWHIEPILQTAGSKHHLQRQHQFQRSRNHSIKVKDHSVNTLEKGHRRKDHMMNI